MKKIICYNINNFTGESTEKSKLIIPTLKEMLENSRSSDKSAIKEQTREISTPQEQEVLLSRQNKNEKISDLKESSC